jgi:hypothetical protein
LVGSILNASEITPFGTLPRQQKNWKPKIELNAERAGTHSPFQSIPPLWLAAIIAVKHHPFAIPKV